jgi:hypothetical protein
MPARTRKRKVVRDLNENAARVVSLSTGQPIPKIVDLSELSKEEERKLRSQAASILGKLGGSKGGKARAATLSADRRAEIARRAAVARWQNS